MPWFRIGWSAVHGSSGRFHQQPRRCGRAACRQRTALGYPFLSVALSSHRFLMNVFLFFSFNWVMVGLQCCIGFHRTTKWIGSVYTYSLFLLNLLLSTPALQGTMAHRAELPVLTCRLPLAICFIQGSVCVSLSSPATHSPCSHICSRHLSVCSCPADSFIYTIFLDSTYMHKYTLLFFSFWLTSLCMTDSRAIHISTNEMAGWHHWLDGRESEWTPGVELSSDWVIFHCKYGTHLL